jgi:hypothetical protein
MILAVMQEAFGGKPRGPDRRSWEDNMTSFKEHVGIGEPCKAAMNLMFHKNVQ